MLTFDEYLNQVRDKLQQKIDKFTSPNVVDSEMLIKFLWEFQKDVDHLCNNATRYKDYEKLCKEFENCKT